MIRHHVRIVSKRVVLSPADVTPPSLMPAHWPGVVTDILHEHCSQCRAHYAATGEPVDTWLGVLEDFVCQGGKRIRPTFVWLGWLAGGGSCNNDMVDALIQVAASLEFVQAGALIHDDILDGSTTRRGKPSVHSLFAHHHELARTQGEAVGNSSHVGQSAAILLGDIALCWADDMFFGANLPPAAQQRALPYWTAMRSEMLSGQYLDIHGETLPYCDAHTAHQVNRWKTAAYTVERPLQIGAACAGATPTLLNALGDYGVNLGIAFQLRDDLLGVFGDPSTTGKPSGEDLREGKRTKLLADAVDHLPPQQAEELWTMVNRPLTSSELARARELITASGAVTHSEQSITELAETATHTVDTLESAGDITAPVAQALRNMVITLTHREH